VKPKCWPRLAVNWLYWRQGLKIPVLVDRAAAALADFVAGANVDGKHVTGINWERDAQITANR
jgi:prolyl-tRNA synthetase